LNIGQYLAKLWARVEYPVFDSEYMYRVHVFKIDYVILVGG